MLNSEYRLYNKLKKTCDISNNDRVIRRVFKAFSEYYGEKADEHQKKALMYLVVTLFLFLLIIVSCLVSI